MYVYGVWLYVQWGELTCLNRVIVLYTRAYINIQFNTNTITLLTLRVFFWNRLFTSSCLTSLITEFTHTQRMVHNAFICVCIYKCMSYFFSFDSCTSISAYIVSIYSRSIIPYPLQLRQWKAVPLTHLCPLYWNCPSRLSNQCSISSSNGIQRPPPQRCCGRGGYSLLN